MRLPWPARAATSALFLINGLGIGAWASSVAPLQARLSLSPAALSLALLAMAAGAIVTMPLAGLLAEKLGGTGRSTTFASLLYPFVLAAPGLAPNLAALVAATFAFGCVNGLMDVSMNAHATAVERRWSGAIMSSFHAAWSGGGILGAALGGAILHAGFAPSVLLPAAAALALAASAFAVRWLGAGDASAAGPAYRWPDARLIGFALIALLGMMSEGAMIDWSALYLTLIAGAPADLAAGGYAVFVGAMLAGRLIGDAVVRRIGRGRVIVLGAALATLGVGIAIAWPAPGVILTGYALMGIGLANLVPAVFSESAARSASPAVGIGMAATVGYAGLLMGPALIGAVASLATLRAGFLLLAAALLAIMPVARRAGRAPS
ncbi:MAG: MFS transporter [Hyphomicrobiales bacterium]|nr:MFS transporter [Hyphomicrobiales bacterium]